ncbi:hypothetical protein TNCV_2601541 [Trichonephila clavipes]|nr:hypothetical protein TNCV_2601541 [Trichonephila clavipes]
MLNDDEIVAFVPEESDPVDDETDEDEDNNNNVVVNVQCRPVSYMHGSSTGFGYTNNRVSDWCPVPVDSDERRSTVSIITTHVCK